MKKIILLTFSIGKENWPQRLGQVGLDEQTLVFPLVHGRESEFCKMVQLDRPAVILLDGQLPFLNIVYKDLNNVISMYDIACSVFSVEEETELPIEHIELNEIKNKLLELV